MKRSHNIVTLSDLNNQQAPPSKKTKVWKQDSLLSSIKTMPSQGRRLVDGASVSCSSSTITPLHASKFLINDKNNGTQVTFVPDYVSKQDSKVLFDKLLTTCNWKTKDYHYAGKTVTSPRMFASISSSSYWVPELLELKKRVEEYTGEVFNFAFINKYEGGKDSIMWHADLEKGLRLGVPIVSISLGQARDFQFRSSKNKNGDIITQNLTDGSMVIMNYETQFHYQHCLPKRKGITGTRINITFRNYK